MDLPFTITTKSASETAKVGEGVAVDLKSRIFCLYGDLGSGKTTFVQGFVKGLGMKSRLLSPTFIIVRRYLLPNELFLYHIDLYRVTDSDQLRQLGLSEILLGPRSIIVIEWAERLGNARPKQRIDIQFSTVEYGSHKITITKIN